jgi:hypothetical protein
MKSMASMSFRAETEDDPKHELTDPSRAICSMHHTSGDETDARNALAHSLP